MSLLLVVVALVVVVIVAFFVVGADHRMPDEPHDRVPADLPEDRLVAQADLDRLRFATELRGYRMDQVDAVLDRAGIDLQRQSERIEQLDAQLVTAGIAPQPWPTWVPEAADADDAHLDGQEPAAGHAADDGDAAAEADTDPVERDA